jgi:hypothetical protein
MRSVFAVVAPLLAGTVSLQIPLSAFFSDQFAYLLIHGDFLVVRVGISSMINRQHLRLVLEPILSKYRYLVKLVLSELFNIFRYWYHFFFL